MKKQNDSTEKIIDTYFNESEDNLISAEEPNILFEDRFKAAMSKMDVINADNISVPNNFFDIINSAEEISLKKSFQKEFISFILVSSLLIAIFGVLIYFTGPKLLIIFEAAMFILLPISLIPIAKLATRRGES